MIDRTFENIGRIVSRAEKSLENPKQYWLSVLTAGITMAFFLICSVGIVLSLIKVLFF